MSKYQKFDLTYVTNDSVSEGVGSSQITPLIHRLNKRGLKINLISFEKTNPQTQLITFFKKLGVEWNPQPFGSSGLIGGVARINNLRRLISNTDLIHARSDIPAVSALASHQAPVLWDVRSLWADQKVLIQKSLLNKGLYQLYRELEDISARNSSGISTLTSAVVPILELRNKRIPSLRTVVPTAVDLDRFKLSPEMPSSRKALFSGTYNDYYDLNLSRLFMEELQSQFSLEAHWARPVESIRFALNVGEKLTFSAPQSGLAEVIPNYSFGVSVCRLDAGPSLTAAMPTKIAEFLACGRPVVVNKGLGDMDNFIEEFNAGVILNGEPSNLTENASKLSELISDPDTPNRCRALAEKYFDMDKGAARYLEMYSQIKKA